MPFDTETISIIESESLMGNAPWIERYLIGIAYKVFARPRVSPDYRVLDELTPSYEMPLVVSRLNVELEKLGFKQTVADSSTMPALVSNLRSVLMNSERANALDWLVGNVNESYWEEAVKQEAWKLGETELFAFCSELVAKNKAAKAQSKNAC
jgi:hypothetical protein